MKKRKLKFHSQTAAVLDKYEEIVEDLKIPMSVRWIARYTHTSPRTVIAIRRAEGIPAAPAGRPPRAETIIARIEDEYVPVGADHRAPRFRRKHRLYLRDERGRFARFVPG